MLSKKEKREMNLDNSYAELFDLIILVEGGKNHYKEDRGGKTNFGISKAFLKLIKIDKDPYDLTLEEAKEIYYKYFYKQFKIEVFKDKLIREFLFELCVNVSPRTYGMICQNAYNLLVAGSPLVVDGIAGSKTRKALTEFRDKKRLLYFLVAESIVHYNKEAKECEKQERFIYGWYNRVLKYIKQA